VKKLSPAVVSDKKIPLEPFIVREQVKGDKGTERIGEDYRSQKVDYETSLGYGLKGVAGPPPPAGAAGAPSKKVLHCRSALMVFVGAVVTEYTAALAYPTMVTGPVVFEQPLAS
jgi:hypothetical protein